MSKAKAATLSTEVVTAPAAAPAEQAPQVTSASLGPLPQTVRLFGPVHTMLAEMMAHSRFGYTLDMDAPLDLFGAAGTISMFLRLGSPAEGIMKAAHATVEAAVVAERAEYTRNVLEAARQLVIDDARKAKETELARARAAAEAELAALQAAKQAEIAALEATL